MVDSRAKARKQKVRQGAWSILRFKKVRKSRREGGGKGGRAESMEPCQKDTGTNLKEPLAPLQAQSTDGCCTG